MRIYTSTSDPIDFCRQHAPTEVEAEARYDNIGDGPDDRGNCFAYDADHPPYADDDYRCDTCGRRLTTRDE